MLRFYIPSSHSNGVMLSVVSLLNHTFTGQAYAKLLTSIVHILSPESLVMLSKSV